MPTRSRTTRDHPQPSAAPAEPEPDAADPPAAPAATLNLPFLKTTVAIPGSGISVEAGPVRVAIPTRYLYYGGLGALAVAGAVEWPIAGALGAAGLIVHRIAKPAGAAASRSGPPAAD